MFGGRAGITEELHHLMVFRVPLSTVGSAAVFLTHQSLNSFSVLTASTIYQGVIETNREYSPEMS